MPEIYERLTTFTTKPVTGQYRYKDKLQIYPSKRKPIREGRLYYPLIIEMSFPQEGEHYYRYGIPFGSDPLTRQIVEVQHLLSAVTQFFFFGHIKAKAPIQKFTNKSCNAIATGNIRWYQDKALDDRNVDSFVIPEFMDSILESYYALPDDLLLAFRKSCYLFYCGVELRSTNPSLSFASFVSAIETLMAFGARSPDTCKDCGQPKYRLRARFRKFILAFGYGGRESAGARKFIDKLYDYRSKILHTDRLLLSDMFWHPVEQKNNGVKKWEESFLHKDLLGVTRVCLLNWVASKKRS